MRGEDGKDTARRKKRAVGQKKNINWLSWIQDSACRIGQMARHRPNISDLVSSLKNGEGRLGKRAIICKGDTTSHGGIVLEGASDATVDGKPIAGVGHLVRCPRCKGDFPILPIIRHDEHRIHDRDTAVEGMKTACGATLIASQSDSTIDDTGEADRYAGEGVADSIAPAAVAMTHSPTLCIECLKAAAENALTMVARG